jgi:hypothetical protein
MPTLRELSLDPRKALTDLEKSLGAQPGDLLRDMENLAPPGEEWGRHLSYKAAIAYYEDEPIRSANQAHVDRCEYCKALLDSLHPTALDAASFAREAGRLYSKSKPQLHVKAAPYALAASVILCAIGAWTYLLAQQQPVVPSPAEVYAGFAFPGGSRGNPVLAVTKSPDSISAGQPVKLVAEIRDNSSDTPVSVVWRDPDDKKVSVSTRWVKQGEKQVSFTEENTAAWKSGEYRAEVWVANEKVLQEPFGVEGR